MHVCQASPFFIDKKQLVIIAAGKIIHVLSLVTGELLFSLKEHESYIVICTSINDGRTILSGGQDGFIIEWDINTQSIINRFDLHAPVYDIIASKTKTDELILVLGRNHSENRDIVLTKGEKHNADKFDYKLVVYDTKAKKTRKRLADLKYPQNCTLIFELEKDEYIITVSKRKLMVISIDSRQGPRTTTDLGPMTCLAIATSKTSQTKDLLITGHESGEISLWHDIQTWLLSNGTSRLTCTVLHWHAHPVATLAFSYDGSHFFSGGEEGVLVMWQVATALKTFVPRLGAPITGVAVSEGHVVIATVDHCTRVMNLASMREEWRVRGLCLSLIGTDFESQSARRIFPADKHHVEKLALDPRTGMLACNGYPGQLQLYDVLSECCRDEVQVVQFTRVSGTSKNTRLFVPSVSLFEFVRYTNPGSIAGSRKRLDSAAGSYLATVDVQRGEGMSAELSLKIWQWSGDDGAGKGDERRGCDTSRGFQLTAQVDRPHGSSRVTSMAFHPLRPILVTSATDGSIKMWSTASAGASFSGASVPPTSSVSIPTSHLHSCGWTCNYSMTYRDAAANALSFSSDGSVLAVAHNNVITLWDPMKVALKATVVNYSSSNIIFSAFIEPSIASELGGGAGEAYLAIGTKQSLSGHFSAFAVASNDYHTLSQHLPGQDSSASTELGWIACAGSMQPLKKPSQCPLVSGGLEHDDGGETDRDEDGLVEPAETEDSAADAKTGEQAIFVFHPRSSHPLQKQSVRSRATSMVFWTAPDCKAVGSGSLVSILEAGGLHTIKSVSSSSTVSDEKKVYANITASTLPAVPFISSSSTGQAEPSSAPPTDSFDGMPPPPPVKADWLQSLFDSSSENIPPVSTLYDSFISRMLQHKVTPEDSNESTDSIPAAEVTVVDDADTGTGTARGLTAMQTERDLEAPDNRQQIFQQGLSAFFGEYLQEKIPTKATTAMNTPTLTKKKKKNVTVVQEVPSEEPTSEVRGGDDRDNAGARMKQMESISTPTRKKAKKNVSMAM